MLEEIKPASLEPFIMLRGSNQTCIRMERLILASEEK